MDIEYNCSYLPIGLLLRALHKPTDCNTVCSILQARQGNVDINHIEREVDHMKKVYKKREDSIERDLDHIKKAYKIFIVFWKFEILFLIFQLGYYFGHYLA